MKKGKSVTYSKDCCSSYIWCRHIIPPSSATWGPTTTTTVTPPPDDGNNTLPLSLPSHLLTPCGHGQTTMTMTTPLQDKMTMKPSPSLPSHLPTPHGHRWMTMVTPPSDDDDDALQGLMRMTTTPSQDKMMMKPSPSPSPPIRLQTWMQVDNDDTFARQMTCGQWQCRCYLGFTGIVIYLTFYKTHDVTEEQGLGRVYCMLWMWLISPAWVWTKLFVDLNSTGIVLWQSLKWPSKLST